jgi:hypothetical protein
MLKVIAKAISASRAGVLLIAFLLAIVAVVESSQPFQACVKEIYITIPAPRISRKVFPLSRLRSLSTVIVLGISLTTMPKQSLPHSRLFSLSPLAFCGLLREIW